MYYTMTITECSKFQYLFNLNLINGSDLLVRKMYSAFPLEMEIKGTFLSLSTVEWF